MLRNRIYYWLKPVLPRRMRVSLRRFLVKGKRRHVNDIWPILPGSERPPMNWPGWPDGKKFALVLTHDVEGPDGVAKCRKLMQLERELGFVSSFNFIPEGKYLTPPELRHEFVTNGFEVGVHDLNHDGRLYASRNQFHRKAAGINRYLKEWNAVGFRSGFMFNQLDWLHELNVQYDASTFDTDPFEPQPYGTGTIFPFWVQGGRNPEAGSQEPRSNSELRTLNSGAVRPGYVELPYTLPQDFTLFLLLEEKGPLTWIRKLDWLAAHGGMALMNVHPDYIQFADESPSARTYPVEYFIQFLKYAQSRYAGEFWQALPREVAAFWKQIMPKPQTTEGYDRHPSSKWRTI